MRIKPTTKSFSSYEPVGEVDMVNNWTKLVGSKATTVEGKAYSGQLNSLMNYYNKAPEATEIDDIDFDHWRNELLTDGFVNTIENNYNSLMEQDYNVESVANDVLTAPSAEYLDISRELMYHFTLWTSYYVENHHELLKLETIGDINKYKCNKLIFVILI